MAGRNPARTRGPVLRRNAMDAASASPGSEALCDGDGQEGTHGIMIPCHNLRHQPTRSDTAQSQQVGHPHGRMVAIAHMLPRPPGSSWETRPDPGCAQRGRRRWRCDRRARDRTVHRPTGSQPLVPARVGRGRTRPSSIPVCLRQPRAGRDRHHRSRHCRAAHLGQREIYDSIKASMGCPASTSPSSAGRSACGNRRQTRRGGESVVT